MKAFLKITLRFPKAFKFGVLQTVLSYTCVSKPASSPIITRTFFRSFEFAILGIQANNTRQIAASGGRNNIPMSAILQCCLSRDVGSRFLATSSQVTPCGSALRGAQSVPCGTYFRRESETSMGKIKVKNDVFCQDLYYILVYEH